MTVPGTTERWFVQTLFVSYGTKKTENWVTANETEDMTEYEALAIAGDNESNRVIHEVVIRTVVPRGYKYGPDNPHPCSGNTGPVALKPHTLDAGLVTDSTAWPCSGKS